MPKKLPISSKYAVWGAIASGLSQSEMNKTYAEMKSQGLEAPHPNTVKNYVKEYKALSPDDKKKIQMRNQLFRAHELPKEIPPQALQIIYRYKSIFEDFKNGKYPYYFDHLRYAQLANHIFTKTLAKWIYFVLSGLNLQIPPTTNWLLQGGVLVTSAKGTPIFVSHIDILRMAEFQESVEIPQLFGEVRAWGADPFEMVTEIIMDEKYKDPDGDIFVFGELSYAPVQFEVFRRFFNNDYALEVQGLIDQARANDYKKAAAENDEKTLKKIRNEKDHQLLLNFKKYAKENLMAKNMEDGEENE